MPDQDPVKPNQELPRAEHGGFVTLAVLAAAAGAGLAWALTPEEGRRRRRRRSRRDKQIMALAGLLIGAGLTALLTPETGPATRKKLGGTLNRIRVGTVDRIERLRQRRDESIESVGQGDTPAGQEDTSVRSVQELGRDPNTVF